MKAGGVALQGALATAALVAAFLVWQRDPVGAPGDVTVVDEPSRALDVVRYEDEARYVELYRDAKDRDQLWVRLGFKPPKPVPPAHAGDAGPHAPDAGVVASPASPVTPAEPPPPKDLRANEVAEKLFARFAPLRATRALGDMDAKKLEEVGLANTPRKLTVTVGGRAQAFSLASPTGSGWGTPYLRRESDGRVFLLGPSLLPDLENASGRLVDRRLHAFDVGDFDTVVVTAGGASRTFKASGQPPGPVALAAVETPDTPDDFARNWHDRVWRLIPLDFLGRDEQPPGGAPQELFRVEYRRGARSVGEVTVAKGEGGLFARTEHTTGWTKLHAGLDSLAGEAAKVVAPVSAAAAKP